MAVWLLLKTLGSLFAVTCILRAYLQFAKLHPMNPLSQLVFRVTDWLVIPLRRLFPPQSKMDWGSIAAGMIVAVLLAIIKFLIISLDPEVAQLGPIVRPFGLVFILALIWLIGWTLKLGVVLVLAQAILSLFSSSQTAAAIRPVLSLLVVPLMRPIQQWLPNPRRGGLDFSPIFLFLILQVLLSIQAWMEAGVSQALFGPL